MLDYDGTLAPFCVNPADAVPYAGVVPLLDRFMEAGHTRLVIVSGRWTKDLIPLLGLKQSPEVWGSHGWERLQANGEYDVARINQGALDALVTADDWIDQIESLGGRCERKPGGLAFHWRGLDNGQVANIRERIFRNWRELNLGRNLGWHDFDGGIELRASGRDKGDVVRAVATEAGNRAVLGYLGDDLTDEQAFKAVPSGGVSVLVRPQFRPTAADVWLRPPEGMLEFLTRWHETATTA
ncbi:MAG: trehalose-phosphatase [Candidatus Muproteobacteria bacterium RBG_16_64_10]|uniref:Trehalose 6-phosphate phosphatase n=1 Tax=Candidatus Muproteobacteria bacterium RBG_16_64_10 TaxID=1817757 RepID=A0A1F6T767_9PROT|nr:MAG: trehalose-phosphatase [Candidatus Muproteobacteria bacterium RBG_16_64_10]